MEIVYLILPVQSTLPDRYVVNGQTNRISLSAPSSNELWSVKEPNRRQGKDVPERTPNVSACDGQFVN
jgi:hypothetical protein